MEVTIGDVMVRLASAEEVARIEATLTRIETRVARNTAALAHQDVLLHAILGAVLNDDAAKIAQVTAKLKDSTDALQAATQAAS